MRTRHMLAGGGCWARRGSREACKARLLGASRARQACASKGMDAEGHWCQEWMHFQRSVGAQRARPQGMDAQGP